ncbi:GAF domain-containing protein [Gramella sp. GC03-9]|uniref:histidine kinase n=1 Tax=Christiangramia oceanisediminis TaxID=2920386 RepID=A0A9X2KWT8_9FLAO|nr:ATP-binding protein [Gramella oceanisediminis]MCP9199934.1 GAF domain-containing protein [Gramella oceanisediminis]
MPQISYPEKVDITNCDKEPIHIIGQSQSHGVIIACDRSKLIITQTGQNTQDFFGMPYTQLLGKPLKDLIGEELIRIFDNRGTEDARLPEREITINGTEFIMVPHFSGKSIIIDFEPIASNHNPYEYQRQLSNILNILNASETPEDLCNDAAKITRDVFGYDRVMVYKFDEEWNGEVIAEKKNEDLESWLGLHYPASDIPKQSRALFMKHRVRIISDVNYEPVPIEPELSPIDHEPLDLSRSELRGVSPIHIEYLQNMNVGASLTAALISNGKLWGLLACHHYSSKHINYYQRQTCEFLTQIFSNELSLKESSKYIAKLDEWEIVREKLVKQVEEKGKIKKGLSQMKVLFTDLMECEGGALLLDGKIILIGKTPGKKEVHQLVDEFLSKQPDSLFFTKNLSAVYPGASRFTETASGILSVKLGRSDRDFLMWFRPEVVQNVSWGGNPDNKASFDETKQRITPRKSFEKWTQELTGVSDPWMDYQLGAARAIRESISNLIQEKQKIKIAKLNDQLRVAHDELELFSQGLSHDLKAPLRGIDGYAHILKEDHYQSLDRDGQKAIDTILSSTSEMQEHIDNILSFAGVTGQNIEKNIFSVNYMVEDILESFNVKSTYPATKIVMEKDLPRMMADKRMMLQVWSNLLANALKYSEREKEPIVEIGARGINGKTTYFVKDNGIGFDPKYKEDIFNLFSRYSGDNFKGTGIGLAIVKKIIEKHNGMIWAESEPGEGSTFYFHV